MKPNQTKPNPFPVTVLIVSPKFYNDGFDIKNPR